MRILEYEGLDLTAVAAAAARVREALGRGDFRAAQAKKLVGGDGRSLYRARLNDSDRLLFTLVRHGAESCVLLLELIRGHDYAGSRFLRGAMVDEARIVDATAEDAQAQALPLRYLHPTRGRVHLLDKPLSFDDIQEAVYAAAPPLVLVGSAGSGKTALTLEKLKRIDGEVLYVTHSAYLAQSARDLYFGHGFEHPRQQAEFLSYREFIETFAVPTGQEATWARFRDWFARMQQAFRGLDAHQAFEEIRGVITARDSGPLTRDDYLALGVRQSIYADTQRAQSYALYEKYREWLKDAGLYDLNLLAHAHHALAQPRYDFVVVDEVQDLTMVQLALVLKTLRQSDRFLLCGDSNQIVHPNFFAWSQVKTLFWRDAELAARQPLRVLAANYRNAARTTELANTLLRIKHARFGSIDRESNYLVDAVGGEAGKATLLADRDTALRALDEQTRRSATVAVLVLRDEDKAAARERFRTPLLFSVHEAKGLEYEHIVLFRFVSGQRAAFAEIADGVDPADLAGGALEYRRGRDKSDKSLEVWKFYVNALYVALTRALRDVWLVESDLQHPLLQLLGLRTEGTAQVEARTSSQEEWQREARKLELQGKQEQADAIRRYVLKQARPPWPLFDASWLRGSLDKAFRERYPGGKLHQQLFEYACYHERAALAQALAEELHYGSATAYARQCRPERSRYLATYLSKGSKEVLGQCAQYGVDHRSSMNHTPLMQATLAGNLPLIEALLERGADPEAADDYGQTAVHLAIRRAVRDRAYAAGPFAAIHARTAPAVFDLQTSSRLVRLDRHQAEYQIVQWMWAMAGDVWTRDSHAIPGFDTATLLSGWEVPDSVVPAARRRRAYLSSVLARNTVGSDYGWNRHLFQRLRQGRYWFAEDLRVRVRDGLEERWVDHRERLGLALMYESALCSPSPLHHQLLGALSPRRPPWADLRATRLQAQARQRQALAHERALARAQEMAVLQADAAAWRRAESERRAAELAARRLQRRDDAALARMVRPAKSAVQPRTPTVEIDIDPASPRPFSPPSEQRSSLEERPQASAPWTLNLRKPKGP